MHIMDPYLVLAILILLVTCLYFYYSVYLRTETVLNLSIYFLVTTGIFLLILSLVSSILLKVPLSSLWSRWFRGKKTTGNMYIESFTEWDNVGTVPITDVCKSRNLVNKDGIGDFRNGAHLPNAVLPVPNNFSVFSFENPGNTEYCLRETKSKEMSFYALDWSLDSLNPSNCSTSLDKTDNDLSVKRTYLFEIWHGFIVTGRDSQAAVSTPTCLPSISTNVVFQFRVYTGSNRGDYGDDVWKTFSVKPKSICDKTIVSATSADLVRWQRLSCVFTVPADATKLIWNIGTNGKDNTYFWTGAYTSRYLLALPTMKITSGLISVVSSRLAKNQTSKTKWNDLSGYNNGFSGESAFQVNDKGVYSTENQLLLGPSTATFVKQSFTVTFTVSHIRPENVFSESEEVLEPPVFFILRGELTSGKNTVQTDLLNVSCSQHCVRIQQGENSSDIVFRTYDTSLTVYSIVITDNRRLELWRDGELVLEERMWFKNDFVPSSRPSEWYLTNWRFIGTVCLHARSLCRDEIVDLKQFFMNHLNSTSLEPEKEIVFVTQKESCNVKYQNKSTMSDSEKNYDLSASRPLPSDAQHFYHMSQLSTDEYENLDPVSKMRVLDDRLLSVCGAKK